MLRSIARSFVGLKIKCRKPHDMRTFAFFGGGRGPLFRTKSLKRRFFWTTSLIHYLFSLPISAIFVSVLIKRVGTMLKEDGRKRTILLFAVFTIFLNKNPIKHTKGCSNLCVRSAAQKIEKLSCHVAFYI